MSQDMRRDFDDREALIVYLREEFPDAAARDPHVSSVAGGRSQAEALLDKVQPRLYARTRNDLDGHVTRLSPYIRYGVLNLGEVRRFTLDRVSSKADAEKLVTELGWRDYWQRKYRELGDGIWHDQEAYKTGFRPSDYADELPQDITNGQTGIPFIDDFCHELLETGYLHNHARMWLAAYIVHWRRVRWQAGARWFLTHLLDGDPASNNLSWQWVASTFSHKPYYYNLANVRKYTGDRYLDHHPAYAAFEGSYEQIARRLFPNTNLAAMQSDNWQRQQKNQRRRGGR